MTGGAVTEKATRVSTSDRSNEEQPIRKVAYQDEMKFLFCVFGIYGSYFLFGYLQEELNLQKFGPEQKKFKNVAFLVFIQCVGNCVCAFFARKVINDKKDPTPFIRYAVISATYVGAMWSSNYAIQFVSYPFMVLAKSCKPIPVLFMGVLVFGKKQGWIKYLCVFLVTVGITIFMSDEIQNSKAGAETSAFGVLLLCMSLAMDGVTGPFQDHLVHQYKPSSTSMMLSTNLWASIYLGIGGNPMGMYVLINKGLLVTGHGKQGLEFVMEFPEVLPHIVLYSVSSAIGQNFIYYTINHFGSLACSLITTTRKFFTILISVLIFGPMLSEIEWVGVGVVFIGLGIDIYISATNKRKKVD